MALFNTDQYRACLSGIAGQQSTTTHGTERHIRAEPGDGAEYGRVLA
jgi:hypothetical protein